MQGKTKSCKHQRLKDIFASEKGKYIVSFPVDNNILGSSLVR